MTYFTLLIPRRPLSHQASSTTHKLRYKDYIYGRAMASNAGKLPLTSAVRMTLIYLYESDPPDINNVIKPIQDALNQLVYADDSQVIDLDAHMRPLAGEFIPAELPSELWEHINNNTECVYLRISECKSLEEAIK